MVRCARINDELIVAWFVVDTGVESRFIWIVVNVCQLSRSNRSGRLSKGRSWSCLVALPFCYWKDDGGGVPPWAAHWAFVCGQDLWKSHQSPPTPCCRCCCCCGCTNNAVPSLLSICLLCHSARIAEAKRLTWQRLFHSESLFLSCPGVG